MQHSLVVGAFTLVAVLSFLLALDAARKRVLERKPARSFKAAGKTMWVQGMSSVVPLVLVAFPEDIRLATERRLAWADVKELSAAEFLSLKIVSAAGIPVIGGMIGALLGIDLLWFVLLGGVGYMLPDLIVQDKIAKRQKSVKKDLTEFATLLATTLQAGGGDVYLALNEVGGRFGGVLGTEVQRAAHEIAAGKRRADALQGIADRCGVDELTQLVQVMLQAGRYGTPVAEAVRQHAAQVRVMQRYQAEKIANEAVVKMTFPMLIFIIAPLLVMLAYPAFIQLRNILL